MYISNSKGLSTVQKSIFFSLIVVAIILIIFLFQVDGNYNEERIYLSEDFEEIKIQNELMYINLKDVQSNQELIALKFVFLDESGLEHLFSTNLNTNSVSDEEDFNYDYVISSKDLGFNDFSKIIRIDIVREYEEPINNQVNEEINNIPFLTIGRAQNFNDNDDDDERRNNFVLNCINNQTQSCIINNGVGEIFRECINGNYSNWSSCELISCNSGYHISENNCVLDSSVSDESMIINHNAAMSFEEIPSCWIEKAKELTFHYAHSSHGGQIISGLDYLEDKDSKYSYSVRVDDSEGLPSVEDPVSMRIYDGTLGGTYATPSLYWKDSGVDYTKEIASTGKYNFSMWSWCGEQSSNSVEEVNNYLSTIHNFENEFPNMRFILMTGHTDGSNLNSESILARNNQLVRDYANEKEMVLFDFADLESWDPEGNFYETATDGCIWCGDWCRDNPSECQDMMDVECVHSQGPICVQKAKAFWWMSARLAGWNGLSESAGANTC